MYSIAKSSGGKKSAKRRNHPVAEAAAVMAAAKAEEERKMVKPSPSKKRKMSSSPSKKHRLTNVGAASLGSSGDQVESKLSKMVESSKIKFEVMKKESVKHKLTEDLKNCKHMIGKLESKVNRLQEEAMEAKEREASLLRSLSQSKKEASKSAKYVKKLERTVGDYTTQVSSLRKKLVKTELERSKLEQDATDSSSLFDDMSNNFKELIENNLSCAVCSEILVSATTISCGHTFCEDCIEQWKKKKSNCPICRSEIKNQAGNIVMDEFIIKMVSQFFVPSVKKQREVLVAERKLKREKRRENDDDDDDSDDDSDDDNSIVQSSSSSSSSSAMSDVSVDTYSRFTSSVFEDDYNNFRYRIGRIRMRFALQQSSPLHSPDSPDEEVFYNLSNNEDSLDSSYDDDDN